MAKRYNWSISKINLYPFGGYVVFNEKLNKPIREELNIVLMGLLFQIGLYIISYFIFHLNIITNNTFFLIKNYHYSILIFNLIPIFPLDGSKIINLLISKKFSYKSSHKFMIYTSYIFLLLLAYIQFKVYNNINLLLITILLVTKVLEENKYHNSKYNKFLLERYLSNIKFKQLKILKTSNLKAIVRDKKHLFFNNYHYITEKKRLKEYFSTKYY
jgi:stage IV sporulation protein FB